MPFGAERLYPAEIINELGEASADGLRHVANLRRFAFTLARMAQQYALAVHEQRPDAGETAVP